MERELLELKDLDSLLRERPSGASEAVEVEIGCGNGHFLVEYARTRPDHVLLGIDRKKRRCQKALSKANRRNLTNVFIIYGRAEELTARLPPASVEAYHIYFPDPWPKSKHRRRRFFRMPQVEMLHRTLKVEGSVYFCTDFFDYYLQARVLLALHGGFTLHDRPPGADICQSLFGKRYLSQGKSVHFTAGSKSGPRRAAGRIDGLSADQVAQRQEHQEEIGHHGQGEEQGGVDLV